MGDKSKIPWCDKGREPSVWIPDPVEHGEDRAERAFDTATEGVEYRCPSCNVVVPIDDAQNTLSADPYAPAVCSKCIEEAFPGAFGPGGNL